jgi:tetratricopeptide (TPR) repeat protein
MSVNTVLRLLIAIVWFSVILLHSSDVLADQETVDWWKAQREATIILMEGETSIAELVANLSTATPENAQDALFKVSVFMRAGMNKETIEALRELKALNPQMENYQVACIYYDACDNVLAWDVAKATVEVFADNLSEMALENRLLKHFLNSGWTVEKVDKWLAGMPKGTQNFWIKERLRFNMKHGLGEVLVRELSDSVREDPQNIEGAIAFLDVLIYARHAGYEKWELSWMAETIKPKLVTQAENIASRLKTLTKWTTAIKFYRQAVDIPLTEEESRKLGMMYAVHVPVERLRAMFAAHAREGIAECLLKLGRNDQAQMWMVEAADIREKHNLGLNALFAGQVQAASGQRIIEDRIKKKEKKSEDDPQYWRERAQYYRGRNEHAQEEEALLKGLALTTPQPELEQHHREHMDWRSWLLADYARFLMREERIGEAVALLRKEIEQAPTVSESAKRAAHLLAFDFYKQISVDDPVLWNWLTNRPKWEHTEERLLWRILESAKQDNLDKHFIHAEEVAFGKDPSRAHTLGWIMNRMHFPKRSIPLLKYAVENAHDKELKERAVFTLLESYLDTGDWKHAEEVFPDAAKRLTPKELLEWFSRVAVTAAKAGAKTDAMRIWSRVANLSPSQIDGLEDLVEAGLRKELKNFYLKMQKEIPSSEVPAKALMVLEKK